MAGDTRIVGGGQNNSPITAATVEPLTRRNALIVAQVNASGDIVNPGGGGSGGDGAILDGANSAIKATVKSATNANPLHVIITNVSGDTPNLAPPGGADGAIVDGVSSSIKATVRDYANSNPVAVVLTNVSGDTYNATTGGSGGDGAINDGVDSGIKATVLNDATTSPSSSNKALVIQFADGTNREVGKVTVRAITSGIGITGDVNVVSSGGMNTREQNVVGVQVVGGSLGGQFSLSGDTTMNANQRGAWAVAITGDNVKTSEQNVIGVNIVGGSVGGRVSISGDSLAVTATDLDIRNLNDSQDSVLVARGQVGVTGDVSTTPKAGQTWPVSIASTVNVAEQNKIGTHVAGGQVGITGDVNISVTIGDVITVGAVTAPIGITGDVSTTPKAGQVWPVQQAGGWAVNLTGDSPIRVSNNVTTVPPVTGAQIVGGSIGGTVALSGDTVVNAIQRGAYATAITGDVKLEQNSNRIIGRIEGPLGVQVVGTSVGQVGISGDVSTTPKAGSTWQVAEQNVTGVQVVGGQIGGKVGISGDVTATDFDIRNLNDAQDSVFVARGRVGVTGEVVVDVQQWNNVAVSAADSLDDSIGGTPIGPLVGAIALGFNDATSGFERFRVEKMNADAVAVNANGGHLITQARLIAFNGTSWDRMRGDTAGLYVKEQLKTGVHVAGGLTGITGDVQARQVGAWATAITGDVKLESNPNRILGRIESPIGVQFAGANTRVPVSGDTVITDGADTSIKGTVKDFANANPLTVALTNSSGDVYNAQTQSNRVETIAGVMSTAGSRLLAAAPAGAKALYVTSYDFQAQADDGHIHIAAGASGTQLTPRWILANREGVAKQVASLGAGHLFRVPPGSGISIEHAGQNISFACSYFTGDA